MSGLKWIYTVFYVGDGNLEIRAFFVVLLLMNAKYKSYGSLFAGFGLIMLRLHYVPGAHGNHFSGHRGQPG